MTIPNSYFVDAEWHHQEQTMIWHNNWWAIGWATDHQPGSVTPVWLGHTPLIITRDWSGTLHVLPNVCSHRGVTLCDHTQQRSVITCPYHAWAYGLDGQCVTTPGTDVEPQAQSLTPLTHHVWRGIIWVNVNSAAEPWPTHYQHLTDHWQPSPAHTQWDGVNHPDLHIQANWKLVVENYLDTYHLATVHPDIHHSLGSVTHREYDTDDSYGGMATRYSGSEEMEYVAVFPNVFVGEQEDHTLMAIIEPLSESTTRVRFRLCDGHTAQDTDSVRAERHRELDHVFAQDKPIMERLHQGRYSCSFQGGVLTARDQSVARFHRWFMTQVAT
jgi:phenylpropionate dioxygenase-like ring-hydroxylating dioxygenase large terminal subunit